jgi:hypothetical protein
MTLKRFLFWILLIVLLNAVFYLVHFHLLP